MQKVKIYDLDNTLVFTDELNTLAYNVALEAHHLPPIMDCARITRKEIITRYPHLDEKTLRTIIQYKQTYFQEHVHLLKFNEALLDSLMTEGTNILWTRAEPERAKAILDYFNLHDRFTHIYYSPKKTLVQDMFTLCCMVKSAAQDLTIYEDEHKIIEPLRHMGLHVVDVTTDLQPLHQMYSY